MIQLNTPEWLYDSKFYKIVGDFTVLATTEFNIPDVGEKNLAVFYINYDK